MDLIIILKAEVHQFDGLQPFPLNSLALCVLLDSIPYSHSPKFIGKIQWT